MTEPRVATAAGPVWRTCLDVEGQDAGHYLDYVNLPLFEVIGGVPQRVLELGCAGGMFGRRLKERYPGATVVGIEAGRAAAEVAATRIDRVIQGRLEDVDFGAHGLRDGEFDTVVAADVLEHLVNPWDVLVRLRPFLAPKAQVVASIPNVRNALLLSALMDHGRFEYRERGLLDVTHLRFFTLAEIRRLFEETGYAFEGHGSIVSPGLVEMLRQNEAKPSVSIRMGRIVFTEMTKEDLRELCTEQFLVRARAP